MGVAPSLQLMGSERIDLYSWAPGPACHADRLCELSHVMCVCVYTPC